MANLPQVQVNLQILATLLRPFGLIAPKLFCFPVFLTMTKVILETRNTQWVRYLCLCFFIPFTKYKTIIVVVVFFSYIKSFRLVLLNHCYFVFLEFSSISLSVIFMSSKDIEIFFFPIPNQVIMTEICLLLFSLFLSSWSGLIIGEKITCGIENCDNLMSL